MAVRFGPDGQLMSVDPDKATSADIGRTFKIPGTSTGSGGGGTTSGYWKNQAAKRRAAEKAAREAEAAREEAARKKEVARKLAEINKLNQLKVNIIRSKKISQEEKNKALKEISQAKEAVRFESKMRTGEMLGFSGTGLTAQQQKRRSALIKLGIAKEVSTRDNRIFAVSPLKTSFFLSTVPTPAEKQSFQAHLKQLMNEFKPPIRSNQSATEKYLNRFRLVQNVKNVAQNLDNKIEQLKRTKGLSARQQLANQVHDQKRTFIQRLKKAGLITSGATARQAAMFALGFSSAIFNFAASIPKITGTVITATPGVVRGTPAFIKGVVKNPKNSLKKGWKFSKVVGKSIKESGKAFGKLLMVEPGLAVGRLAGEFYVMKGIGKGFKVTGKLSAAATRPLNPFFKKIKAGQIIIRKAPQESFRVGKTTRLLAKRVKKASFKRPFSSVADFLKGRKPGQFKKFTKNPGLILKESTVASSGRKLSEQVAFAGKEVTAVNAAANQITNWLKLKKIIRKPIPGERNFPATIKRILKKFDKGTKLSRREFASVNKWLQKNVAANTTLLERSLYLDPASGLRLSRLGIVPEGRAGIRDILTGNFKIFGSKPQVLIFEKARVQKFPKALRKIRDKLLRDQKLTIRETNQLIRFQTTKSGLFKPIGSTIYQGGVELEVTLAPGEFIKRLRKAGFTVVKGKKVSIVMAEVWKPSTAIAKQIKLARLGKLSIKQLKRLQKVISKATGTRVKIARVGNKLSKLKRKVRRLIPKKKGKKIIRRVKKTRRRAKGVKPVLRAPRGSSSLLRKARRGAKRTTRKVGKRATRRPAKRTTRKVGKRATRRVVKRTTRKVGKRATRRVVKRTTRKVGKRATRRVVKRPVKRGGLSRGPTKSKPQVLPRIPKKFKQRKLKKAQDVFYIKIKRGGKIRNLNQRPLTLKDARDFLAYKIDHGLSRSAWFEPMGRTTKVVRVPKFMGGYFNRNRRKLRAFKIRVGKKKAIRNGFIEKRKFIQDTRREKLQLKLAKRKAGGKVVKRKIVKRKPVKRKRKR